MTYKTLQELIESQSLMDDGFAFLVANPREFSTLVRLDPPLALRFAKAFTQEQAEAMLSKSYGMFQHDKFITILLATDPRSMAFKDIVSKKAMLDYFLSRKLQMLDVSKEHPKYSTQYSDDGEEFNFVFFFKDKDHNEPILWAQQSENMTEKEYLYGAGLETRYRLETQDADLRAQLLEIAAAFLQHVKKPEILNGEFIEELTSLTQSRTNTLYPNLMKHPSTAMSDVVATTLRLTSFSVSLRELAAVDPNTNLTYLHQIISYLPVTRSAYDAAFDCIRAGVASKGKNALDRYLKRFNVDLLQLLQEKDAELAEAFFKLGNINLKMGEENPMIKKYPHTSKIYLSPPVQRLDSFVSSNDKWQIMDPQASTSTSSNSNAFFSNTQQNLQIAIAPPPYDQEPFITPVQSREYQEIIAENVSLIETQAREIDELKLKLAQAGIYPEQKSYN